MKIPTIHLNGTSKEALLDAVSDARYKLLETIDVLENGWLNARDFYPQGAEAWPVAVKENAVRIAKLKEVYTELGDIAIGISDQGKNRGNLKPLGV